MRAPQDIENCGNFGCVVCEPRQCSGDQGGLGHYCNPMARYIGYYGFVSVPSRVVADPNRHDSSVIHSVAREILARTL